MKKSWQYGWGENRNQPEAADALCGFLLILWKNFPPNPAETIAFSGGLCYHEENYTGGMLTFSDSMPSSPEVPNENLYL